MSMDKVLWWNCFQVLIIINLTLCQNKYKKTDYALENNGLPENTTIKLLVEPDNTTDSLLVNSGVTNDNRGIERKNLMSLYELKKKNYLSLINEERTQISNQMQTISEIINSFVDKDNKTETRVTRSVSPRPKCTISREKLVNLQKEIHSIIANSTEQNVTDIKCTLDFDATDNCNNLLKAIQCGLDHVKNGFIEAMLNQSSAKEVTKWKNAFDELSIKFAKEKDDLRQSFSHEHQLELDKLHKQLQDLGKSLNIALERLEKNTVELCVMEIVQGMVTEAVDHFNELKSTSTNVIVKQACNFNKHSNPEEIERVAYIAEFIERVPIKGYDVALNTLFKEIKARNLLNSIRGLILFYSFEAFGIPLTEMPEIRSEFENFVDPFLSTLTDILAFNKKDTEFYKFLRYNSGKYFDFYSDNIINMALHQKSPDDKIRVKNILDNIRNFPYYNQAADGFACVVNYINNELSILESQNTLRLIYYVNYFKTKISTEKKRSTENLVRKFDNVFQRLPNNVVNFIVHPNACKLTNRVHPLFLYADGQFKADGDRRNVFLWKHVTQPSGTRIQESQWKFETSNNCESFIIKNVRYNEMLYAADMWDNRGNPRRPVFTWKKQDPAFPGTEWEVIPRFGGSFTLRNVYRNEYFFADSASFRDDDRRNVFTWKSGKPEGDMWIESLWNIQC